MSWETYKVKDLCSDIIDCVNKTAPISETPTEYKMLRTSDIRNGTINIFGLNCVSKEIFDIWTRRGKLHKGDIIFTREAPLGEVGLVRYPDNYFLGQRLVLFRANPQVCDNRFLLYAFLHHENKQSIIAKGVGATVLHLRVPECEKIEIKAPDINTQHRIADILSAYDDLIENNQKQIKLLEEAAQRLYKEWFVDLRFPGYENTPITDGVPQGWKQEPIDEVYSIKYGKNLPTTEISEAGKYPVYGANGVIGYYHKFNCDSYVTLITSRGNGSGDVSRTHHSNSFVTNNSFIVIPQQTHNFISNEFTYWLMKYTDFKSVCTGSAQPQLTNNSISTLKVLIPTKKLILCFCEITRMYFENVEKLLRQNRLLIEARDRLLPKLMSGELEV